MNVELFRAFARLIVVQYEFGMKNTTVLLAEYNRHVNRLLHDLLATQDPALLEQDAGSYFGSIAGLLNHILLSCLGWLLRFRDGGLECDALENDVLVFTHPGFGELLYTDLPRLRSHQEKTDELLIRLTTDLAGAGGPTLDSVISYTDTRGKTHAYPVGGVLVHVLNHATHHRGQISQILDAAGVEHDFSSLLAIVPPAQ